MIVKDITIRGFSNISDFITEWSKHYTYNVKGVYEKHISGGISNIDSFRALFAWKNGSKSWDKVSKAKRESIDKYWNEKDVLASVGESLELDKFESEFRPDRNACIWKTFLLHIANPEQFPIYDQHVYRCYEFINDGKIEEIPNRDKLKYDHYKNKYLPWYRDLKNQTNLDGKIIDNACFAYGKMLKSLKTYPITIA